MMRKAATLTLVFLFTAMSIFAGTEELAIDAGATKTSKAGKIKVTFVQIEEDSRCPEGTTCVWAGNVRVKIKLAKGKKAARTFDLNSNIEPKVIVFEGYDIAFVDLSPQRTMSKVAVRNVTLTVSITKHK